ncbi:ACP S-malonyltransferase [Sphaerisporangium corydalis]|uniref:[acyl-carrier-protein] S-malonyltransferase n=1 Tax=Sphaerisporangium corydalis TaxID=1441875 RepID=A0ABV9EAI5_9ACTN|nr:ACP S-malonyltransferase [Sphaerisporangium corydalis]
MLAIVAPGQGAQTPGFLTPWLEVPGVRRRLAAYSESAGLDLITLGTDADAETIRDTAVAQPLLTAAALVAAEVIFGDLAGPAIPAVVAGHSVGEFAAAALAGVLRPEEAVALVAERGRAMAEASAVTPTGMLAVLGGDPDEVAAALERHGLVAANHNGAGQVIAGGTTGQLDALRAAPPAGARLRPLAVAGAFHTPHMAPAAERLAAAARDLRPEDPRTPLLSNHDGTLVTSGAEYLRRLVVQVTSPVRWDACQDTLAGLGVTTLVELPPAGTLVNLARRALPGTTGHAVKTPADAGAVRELFAVETV